MQLRHVDGCCCPGCLGPREDDALYSSGSGSLVTSSSSSTKPLYDPGQLIHALTTKDGAQPSVAWANDIVSFSIATGQIDSTHDEYTSEMDGYVAMTAVMEAVAREAFALWDELIAIDLLEMDDWPDAHITFNYSSNTDNGATYAKYAYWEIDNQPRSDYRLADADLWFADDWSTHDEDSDLTQGSYGIITYLHEIGHALGLTHPGDYNGSATYDTDATHQQDTLQYTVMSYFAAGADGSDVDHFGTDGWSYGATPLLHDILAAQAVYGANTETRTGDTIYGFNSTAGRAAFDFTVNQNPVVALWDAGGIDRIDASGWNTDQVIDLNAGAFSSVGHLTENLAIAHGATIEQAVGGGGNDRLIGNAADNLLAGGAGDDVLEGGAGADRLEGQGGRDLADYRNSGAGVTVNLNAGAGSGGDAEGDTLVSIEDITGSEHADFLVGNGGDNVLTGLGGNDALIAGAGDDVLDGGDGADFLSGHLGIDSLFGGAGNDVLRGGPGADEIFGGSGFDWLLYNTATEAVTVDLSQNAGLSGEAAGDTIFEVEHLIGTRHADTLTGDGIRNYLLGGDGDDVLDGGAGWDVLKGQDGDDTLIGGDGRDLLLGGAGADALFGGAGNDWASHIEASEGVGVDLGNGGFHGEAAGDTYDSIEHAEGSVFADHLIGDESTNLLRGHAGDDIIEGRGGDDVMDGGAGADLFVFYAGDGVDRINGFALDFDLIRIESGAAEFNDLIIDSFNGSATVTYDPADTIVLSGIDSSLVTEDLFQFA